MCLMMTVCIGTLGTYAQKKVQSVKATPRTFLYRVYLHDKHGTPYTLDKPQRYLSPRAILRRQRQGIAIDSTDLPVSPAYVDALRRHGLRVMGTSRWRNTAMVASQTDDVAERLRTWPLWTVACGCMYHQR